MKHSRRSHCVAFSMIATIALSAEFVVNEKNVATFYRAFPRLTEEPLPTSPLMSMLCTLNPSREEVARLEELDKQQRGPHYGVRSHLYANPLALPIIPGRMNGYPVGSILVKEKLNGDLQVTGVGGMIKRDPGYDPENGDWEYFYSGEGRFGSGHLRNCVDCHRSARDTDFVFTAWKHASRPRGE